MAELEAGRALNELIAGKLREWAPFRPGKGPVAAYPLDELSMGMYAELIPTPPYSTDVAAAWHIVERMRAEGWQIVVDTRPGNWLVQFFSTDGTQRSAASADGLPLAICRAAVAALDNAGN